MTTSTQTNTTPFPWEQWAQLPKVEREAEMKEAQKENYQAEEYFEADQTEAAANAENKCEWVITTYPVPPYGHGRWVCPQKDVDPVTGETADIDAVGHGIHQHVPPFPFWDVAEQTIETEAVGGHFFDTAEPEAVGRPRGLFPLPDFSDQSANVDEQQNTQVDPVTGYSLNNDDTAGFDWFQMNHDDGIMDGYLDTAENTNGSLMTTEPIPEFTVFLPGQAIKLEESGMDGLVAAGPFDTVTPNEPQKNDVF